MSRRKYLIVINILLPAALLVALSQYLVKRAEQRLSAVQVLTRNELRPADLTGIWQSSGYQCFITIRDRKLQAINSIGASTFLELDQTGITAPAWNLEGAVSSDYRRIAWSDGTIWSR